MLRHKCPIVVTKASCEQVRLCQNRVGALPKNCPSGCGNFVGNIMRIKSLKNRQDCLQLTFCGLAKVAIFTTNVDAENKTLINHKCVCGALNRHFCQTAVRCWRSFCRCSVVHCLQCLWCVCLVALLLFLLGFVRLQKSKCATKCVGYCPSIIFCSTIVIS